MNALFSGLMRDAAQLTRDGRLGEATQLIQRALQGKTPAAEVPPTAFPAAVEDDVIEAQVRVVEVTQTPEPHGSEASDAWTRGSFTHQGRSVDYMLFVPASASAQSAAGRPLVLMLHGCTQDAADFAAGTRMNEHARDSGCIVLYPEQAKRAHGQKCWNWFKTQHQARGRGEPALLAALTEHIVAQQQADRSRVYVGGLSAGGAMADVLGHCYPDLYAAVGVHSGLPHGAAHDMMSALNVMRTGAPAPRDSADNMRPPTIVFHGDQDATVHPGNGREIVAGATPSSTSEGRSAAGRRYTRTVYAGSARRGDAEHWLLHGAGHAWSGGSARGSYTQSDGVDASAEMMRFFLAHRGRPSA